MWEKIKKWAKDSETVAWAKIQFWVGLLGSAFLFAADVIVGVDFAAWLKPGWLPLYLVANGLLTKWLRLRRTESVQ